MTKDIINEPVIPKDQLVKRPTLFHRIFDFKNLLIISFISFLILTFFARLYPYFSFDLYIARLIQSIDNPVFDLYLKLITKAGDYFWGTLIVLAMAFLVAVLLRIKEGVLVLISSFGAYIISIFLKSLVGRPRPDADLINQIGNFVKSDSFPSGHVLYYMGLYGCLLFLVYTKIKKGWIRNLLMGTILALLVSIGVSRIYLGAHWFSDTLGSYLIGISWLFVVVNIYKKILKR